MAATSLIVPPDVCCHVHHRAGRHRLAAPQYSEPVLFFTFARPAGFWYYIIGGGGRSYHAFISAVQFHRLYRFAKWCVRHVANQGVAEVRSSPNLCRHDPYGFRIWRFVANITSTGFCTVHIYLPAHRHASGGEETDCTIWQCLSWLL